MDRRRADRGRAREIGIALAFVGGWVFSMFGYVGVTGFDIGSIVVAFVGAVVSLAVLRAVACRRSTV